MIEIIDPSRCTACNICVRVCPTNVFDTVPDAQPTIARQRDCQTCFMCELYCPDDALYVAPTVEPLQGHEVHALRAEAPLGSYRQAIGWSERPGRRFNDASFKLLGR